MSSPTSPDVLELIDYRRRVTELYRQVREADGAGPAWRRWRDGRDALFRTHPQSPYQARARTTFDTLPYFDHDPAWRTVGRLEVDGRAESFTIGHSSGGHTNATRVGVLVFELAGEQRMLSAYWLEQYGGGLFVPFRDTTSGATTYGGGRYLLDTAKGADLGTAAGALVLDFNYAYHPSCAHDPRWSCPLALPDDRIDLAVEAGERSRSAADPGQ